MYINITWNSTPKYVLIPLRLYQFYKNAHFVQNKAFSWTKFPRKSSSCRQAHPFRETIYLGPKKLIS